MERVPTLNGLPTSRDREGAVGRGAPLRSRLVGTCLALSLAAGCVSPRKARDIPPPASPLPAPAPAAKAAGSVWPVSYQEIKDATAAVLSPGGDKAADMVCIWQNRVSYLPDPTKNGAMGPGLAGQMFLLGPGSQFVHANGRLTVDLYDETRKAAGVEPRLIERWAFDKETLKKLTTVDETFGRNYTLFLPWPSYRPDLNRVRLTVRYDPVSGPPLYAPDASVTLDPSATGQPVWSGGSTSGPQAFPTPGGLATPSLPPPMPSSGPPQPPAGGAAQAAAGPAAVRDHLGAERRGVRRKRHADGRTSNVRTCKARKKHSERRRRPREPDAPARSSKALERTSHNCSGLGHTRDACATTAAGSVVAHASRVCDRPVTVKRSPLLQNEGACGVEGPGVPGPFESAEAPVLSPAPKTLLARRAHEAAPRGHD